MLLVIHCSQQTHEDDNVTPFSYNKLKSLRMGQPNKENEEELVC